MYVKNTTRIHYGRSRVIIRVLFILHNKIPTGWRLCQLDFQLSQSAEGSLSSRATSEIVLAIREMSSTLSDLPWLQTDVQLASRMPASLKTIVPSFLQSLIAAICIAYLQWLGPVLTSGEKQLTETASSLPRDQQTNPWLESAGQKELHVIRPHGQGQGKAVS